MIEHLHFLRPWWLATLPSVIVFIWFASRRADVRGRWREAIAPHLLDHLVVEATARGVIRPYHLLAVTVVLGSVASAGPTWEHERPPFVEDNAPLVIAVDLSQTMDAIDITPSRLARAKLKIRDIVALRPGGRTAVVAYAGSAHMVLPLTDDASLIETYVDALATGIMPVGGRDTAAALYLARNLLKQDDVGGTILLMTDGVEEKAFTAFGESDRSAIVVLGIGTAAGGPVKTADGNFLTAATGGRLFAKLDVDTLKKLHSDTGTDVATVTVDDADVRWAVGRIRTHFEQKTAEIGDRWKDVGWWLTIPVILLAALSFRRGWVVRWATAFFLVHMVLGTSPSQAADWHFTDLWLTQDQQGRNAFERGKFAEAATHFQNGAWRGTALYRAGKYDEAVDAFAALDTPESYFGQGNALMHLGKLDEAVAAYKQALAMRKDWPDAAFNLSLAEKLQAAKKKDDDEGDDASQKPDKFQFDDKGKEGKKATMTLAEQTSEMWMKNIEVSPADLMARKFAIEAKGKKP